MRIKISQLDSGVAAPDSVVPASNAAIVQNFDDPFLVGVGQGHGVHSRPVDAFDLGVFVDIRKPPVQRLEKLESGFWKNSLGSKRPTSYVCSHIVEDIHIVAPLLDVL